MDPIRVVWGTGAGPTEIAAYDAALEAANVHNYNLVAVSSVIPAGAEVAAVGEAPDLGPVGERVTVVEASTVGSVAGTGDDEPAETTVSAGLGWSQAPDGRGLFYEAAGEIDATEIRDRIERGLAAGRALRDWDFEVTEIRTVGVGGDAGAGTEAGTGLEAGTKEYVAAIVLAVYGRSEPIL
jgi:arginine decarboxylase